MTAKQTTIFGTETTTTKTPVLPTWNNGETRGWTLIHARDHLERRVREGAHCPCCGQRAQVYRRVLNAGMARALVLMWKETKRQMSLGVPRADALVDIKRIDVRGGDYAKLAYWRLIESIDDEEKMHQGWWKVTLAGEDFVERHTMVPAAVYVYDGRVLDEQDVAKVSIRMALGKKFDLFELMRGGGQ